MQLLRFHGKFDLPWAWFQFFYVFCSNYGNSREIYCERSTSYETWVPEKVKFSHFLASTNSCKDTQPEADCGNSNASCFPFGPGCI